MALKKVSYEFNPFDLVNIDPPEGKKLQAIEEIKSFVLSQTKQFVAQSKSPVGAGKFKRVLSKKYQKISGKRLSNLKLSGDMLGALKVIRKRGEGDVLSLQIAGKQAPKADGHTNHSGNSSLPAREFIPDNGKDQTFKLTILKGIRSIIEDLE